MIATKMITVMIAAAAGFLVGSISTNPAAAHEPPQASVPAQQNRAKPMRERFDLNADGALDESERSAARETIKQRMLERFDADKNGILEQGERPMRGLRQMARHRMKMHLKQRFDANADGKLDADERAQARTTIRTKLLERFDADGSGQLEPNERAEIRKAMRERMRQHIHRRHLERSEAKGVKGKPEAQQTAP